MASGRHSGPLTASPRAAGLRRRGVAGRSPGSRSMPAPMRPSCRRSGSSGRRGGLRPRPWRGSRHRMSCSARRWRRRDGRWRGSACIEPERRVCRDPRVRRDRRWSHRRRRRSRRSDRLAVPPGPRFAERVCRARRCQARRRGGARSRCDHARRTGAHALSRPGSSSRGARGPRFAERIDLPFLLGTARTSDHTPAKPLGYVLHFLVGPAFAAQTLAADLAYGTLVGGFFSLAG